jgi:hypothetical protein
MAKAPLLQIVIRVCALCSSAQDRPDDASIMGLIDALQDQEIREGLLDAGKCWRAAIGYQAERCANVQTSIGMLKRRWSHISSRPEVLERLHRFRNKRLGRVTIAAKPNQEAQLIELWRMARNALSAARQIRLVFHRENFNYLQSSSRAEVVRRKLIVAIKPRTAK